MKYSPPAPFNAIAGALKRLATAWAPVLCLALPAVSAYGQAPTPAVNIGWIGNPPTITDRGSTRAIVTEGEDAIMYTISITARPTADVTITREHRLGATFQATGELRESLEFTTSAAGALPPVTTRPGTSSERLNVSHVFTPSNWATAQTVTIAYLDDFVDSGERARFRTTHALTTSDAGYTAYRGTFNDTTWWNHTTLNIQATDNDAPGIFATATFNVHENGVGEYAVWLGTMVTSNLVISVTTPGGITANPPFLTFTPTTDAVGGWNVPQTVIVSAGDDLDAEDDTITILHGMVDPDDPSYDIINLGVGNLHVDNPTAILLDDDVGVVIEHAVHEVEEGSEGSYAVHLRGAPDAAVTVTVNSNAAPGTVTPTRLTFTTDNWAQPQQVTITAAPDNDINDETLTITHRATSTDPQYTGTRATYAYQDGSGMDTDATELRVIIVDDDAPGAVVSATALQLPPGGESPSYTVRLAGREPPAANVTVTASVPDNSPVEVQSTAGTPFLVFTEENYQAPQTLTVAAKAGVKPADDVDVTITHRTLGDVAYTALPLTDVTVSVQGHILLSIADATANEDDGEMVFTASLNRVHTQDVILDVGIVLGGEGGGAAAAPPASAADFTASFVADAVTIKTGRTQTRVTVPLLNDGIAEDDETFELHVYGEDVQRHADPAAMNRTTSRPVVWKGGASSGERIPDLNATYGETITLYATGTIVDGTLPVVSVLGDGSAIMPSPEDGSFQAIEFVVFIDTEPDAELTLTPMPPQNSRLTVTPDVLVFTGGNWSTIRTVTVAVTGGEDADSVDNTVAIAWTKTGGGANYTPVTIADTEVVIREPGPEVGLVFTPQGGSEDDDAISLVAPSRATYGLSLAAAPGAAATVALSSGPSSEGRAEALSVTPDSLVFTDADWQTVQTVTIVARAGAAGETVTISHAVSGNLRVRDLQIPVMILDPPAQVTDMEVESDPRDVRRGYVVGEAITIRVFFSNPTPVSGKPQLRLRIGDNTRLADLAGEVPSDAVDSLAFAYTIQTDDIGAAVVETVGDDLFQGGGAALSAAEVPSSLLAYALPDAKLTVLFVDAGDDQTVLEQKAVTLEGSASTDEQPITYRWTQHEDNDITVQLKDADKATATFTTPNLAGSVTLTFILQVTAGSDEASDEVTVEVEATNEPPTVTASANPTTVNEGEMVTLTGTGSDPEGLPITYAWSIQDAAGQTIALNRPSPATATFTAPTDLTRDVILGFRLEVSDGDQKASVIVPVPVRAGGDPSEVLGYSLSRMGRLMAMSARDAVGERVGAGAASAKRVRRGLTLNGSRIDTAMNAWLRNVTPLSIQGSAQGGLGPAGYVPGAVPWSTTTAYRGAAGDACGGGHARPVSADCNHFAERVLAGGPTLPPALTPWNRYSNITSFEYALGLGASSTDTDKDAAREQKQAAKEAARQEKQAAREAARQERQAAKEAARQEKQAAKSGQDKSSGLLSDTSLWGQFDARAFASEPTSLLALEGSMTAFHVGIDKLYNGRDAVGIALGLPSNTVDFTRGEVKGEVSLSMVNFHPYASWSPRNGLFNVWGMLGFGSGESEVTVKSQETQTADTSMAMFAGGGRLPLVKVGIRDFGDIHVAVKADAFSVSMSSDGTEALAEQSVSASQLRAVLEGRMTYAMSDSTLFEPVLEFGVRTDGGDGDTGMGMEMGLGATYTNTAMGLSADGRGRFLVTHGGDEVAEAGYSLLLLYNPGNPGGLGLTFAPVWGETASQADALWHAQDLSRFTLHHAPGGHGLSGRGAARGWHPERMDISLHYGIERARWLVTPYGTLATGGAGDDRERVRLGLHLEALRLAAGTLRLNLFNERDEGPGFETALRMLLH